MGQWSYVTENVGRGEVDLLIGLDYAPLILPEKALRSEEDPDGIPSDAFMRLGCYLFGGLRDVSFFVSVCVWRGGGGM